MKKILIALSASALIFSCSTQQKQDSTQQVTDKMVGNDQDENGCKGSAGYQWSQLKNTCIRYFEEGIKLNPVNKTSTTVAYLIVIGDKIEASAAELPKPLVLTQQNSTTWENGQWKIEMKDGIYNLKKNGQILYHN